MPAATPKLIKLTTLPTRAPFAAKERSRSTAEPPPVRMLLPQGGPLELPRSVLGVLLDFADHRSVHQLEATSRHASALIRATGAFSSLSSSADAIQCAHVDVCAFCVAACTGFWRTTALKRTALHVRSEHDDPSNERLAAGGACWKRLACMTTIPTQRDRNLLLDVHGALNAVLAFALS